MQAWDNEKEWINLTNYGSGLLAREGSMQQAFHYLIQQLNFYLPVDIISCAIRISDDEMIDIAEGYSEDYKNFKNPTMSTGYYEIEKISVDNYPGPVYALNSSDSATAIPIKTRHFDCHSMVSFSVEEKVTRNMFIAMLSKEKNVFTEKVIRNCLQATKDVRHILKMLFALPQMSDATSYFQKQKNSYDLLRMCRGLSHTLKLVEKVAPLSTTVLVIGETGVGKELVAETLHYLSPRNSAPFLKVNCGSLPHNLIESILFGHDKGAFTGATESKSGYFEDADMGSLFLDEIGELPLDAQARLLRVLENGEISRVGSTRTRTVDVRIIAATHRDLKSMVAQGLFRADLFYRLAAFPVSIPPLRDRRIDIPVLVTYYFKNLCEKLGLKHMPTIPNAFITDCTSAEWAGNVRELIHALEYSFILSQVMGTPLVLTFPFLDKVDSPREESILPLEEMNKQYIERVLKKTNFVIHGEKGAAKLLRINPSTLKSRMRALGIKRKGLLEEG